MCGVPYDKCTKEKFVQYLGVDNPEVPFPIYIKFNESSGPASYFNQTTFLCSDPVVSRYENYSSCGCLVNRITFTLIKL